MKRKYTKRRTYGDPELWRKVRDVMFTRSRWSPKWAHRGSNHLFLECGHVLFRKASVPVPEVVFCKECERVAAWRAAEERLKGGAR